MVVFGITGGSGSGKTSVSKMLEKLGVHIIDTDVIAHEIVEPNSDCLNELVDYFGDSILNDDKTLNRKKLASIAFSDKQKTEALSNDEQAIQRINAQNDDEFYKENSMYIIYNNGDIAQLESDVVGLFNKIKGNSFE